MSGVQRLKQVEGLRAANLPQKNAVRPMSQRGAQQIGNGHRRNRSFLPKRHLCPSRLEPDQVRFLYQDLRGLFNEYDSIRVRNSGRKPIQQRRFSRSRSAGDEDVLAPIHSATQFVGKLGGQRPYRRRAPRASSGV